jgi:Carboxypeptidase regulatory-like domain
MFKTIIFVLLPFLAIFDFGSNQTQLTSGLNTAVRNETSGTLEKMIVQSGSVQMDVDFGKIAKSGNYSKYSSPSVLRFDVEQNSFFSALVFNGELRGPLPGTMPINPQENMVLPAKLNASYNQLVVENISWGGQYELAVRDGKTGFTFFNIEGHEYNYNQFDRSLLIHDGRLLLSKEFAAELGRPTKEGTIIGQISIKTTMRAVEVTQVVDGEVKSEKLPASSDPQAGTVPGPDVVVGDLNGLAQFGASSGTQVGLAVGTDSCNFGTVDLDWFALPSNNHPVIPQNLYRMSGGPTNDLRFEQIGQSSVKHAFTALTNNICGLGCNGVGGTRLGSGCSDPYSASLNSGPSLGSRAWINPFTGVYPRGDSGTTNPNNHTGHTHTGPSHRILTEIVDLNTTLNAGATYYAESQYVTPHEYVWCQANPTQCNMNNNVSYRRYNVTGTASPFSFSPFAATVRAKTAVTAWTGASVVEIKPDPVNDGIGSVAYKVTNPSPGVWHYEYAIFNQNLDRGIGSFTVPLGSGATISNVGFHAPPQQPGSANDGTVGSAGFSSTAWTTNQTATSFTWSTETLALNPNANAIRWGTLYNFSFDSNRPPQNVSATVGFFKTGSPASLTIQGPGAVPVPVAVSGRVTTTSGRGLMNARVSMTDSAGNVRRTMTGPFGYYHFNDVMTGSSYTFAVQSKSYRYTARVVAINNSLSDINFTPNP